MAGSLRIVAGCRTIAPDHFPVQLAGRQPAGHAHKPGDPLEVNALLIQGTTRKALLLTFDLLYIGGVLEERIRQRLKSRYGLRKSELLLLASHTHFAPPTDPTLTHLGDFDRTYTDRVAIEVNNLVEELFSKPARQCVMETMQGNLALSVNRRKPRVLPSYSRDRGITWDRVSLAPFEDGPTEDTATIIRFSCSATNEPIAALWHFACHPVGRAPKDVTSADFPGIAREAMRHNGLGNLPVLFLQGFCGDVRPTVDAGRSAAGPLSLRSFLQRIPGVKSTLHMSTANWRTWSERMHAGITRIYNSPPSSVSAPHDLSCQHIEVPIERFFDGTITRKHLNIWAIRLGDSLEVLGFGAEPSTLWREILTTRIGRPKNLRLFGAYCGDVFGYLPTPEQIREGGYEVSGFQRFFGMEGSFHATKLRDSISEAVIVLIRGLEAT